MRTTDARKNHRLLDDTPPHSIEAEQAVLGAMLLDTDGIPAVLGLLTVDDFYRDAHQKIFAAICDLHNEGKPVDEQVLYDSLKRRPQIRARHPFG